MENFSNEHALPFNSGLSGCMEPLVSSFKRWWILLVVSMCLLLANKVSAQIPGSFCDGNPSDLANFTTTYPIHAYSYDVSRPDGTENQFTGGSKDETPISGLRWSYGQANDKGNIINAGAALAGDNNCILRFFGDRLSNNGDASIGFWFYVNPVSTNPNGTFSGTHTNGDLLIISDFTNGGTRPAIKVYVWQGSGLVLQSPGDNYCANVNQEPYDVPAGFTYTPKGGGSKYPVNTFFEGAIDLCKLGIASCFSSFLVETRNSQELSASLQDFTTGAFNATPPPPTYSVTPPSCTVATGSITITNYNAAYTYLLTKAGSSYTQTNGVYSNMQPGTYTLTVSRGSCSAAPITIVVPNAPPVPATPTATAQGPGCGGTTGSITVTGPLGEQYSYKLDNGSYQSGTSFTGVTPGDHTLTVKQGECTKSATINVPDAPSMPAMPTANVTQPTCTVTTGIVTVNSPIGGLNYMISGGTNYNSTNGTFNGVLPGSYTLTASNGTCTSSGSPVTVNAAPTNCQAEGCTLGYWKNHTDRWCDMYKSNSTYGSIFVDAPTELKSLTLLKALNLQGGGIYNLARQSVAALLNVCSPSVTYVAKYEASIALLISDVNAAYRSSTKSAAGALASTLDGYNNAGCPLGGTPATTSAASSSTSVLMGAAAQLQKGDKALNVFPNPFARNATIEFTLAKAQPYSVQIFDVSGRMIVRVAEGMAEAGKAYTLDLNARDIPSGIYMVRLTTGQSVQTHRMIVNK